MSLCLSRIVLLPAVALICALSGAQTKRALLIGINSYNWPGKQRTENSVRKTISNLQGCENDAQAMFDMITSPKWGFDKANAKLMNKPKEPTRQAILGAIRTHLIEGSKSGDTVLFYYSGHGAQVKNSLSNERDKRDETLIPADTLYGAKDITDKELARLFMELLDKGVKLTVIVDSCHSGSVSRGLRKRYPKQGPDAKGDTKDTYSKEPSQHGALILSSARDFEQAEEDRTDDKNPHGAFSKCLLRVMGEADVNAPAESISLASRAALKTTGMFSQEPVLEAKDERKRRGLFGDDAGPGGRLRVAVISNKEGQIILQGGLAFGLQPGCELSYPSASDERVRIKIIGRPSMSRSEAKVTKGSGAVLRAGSFLEVSAWMSSNKPALKVWIPESALSAAMLLDKARALSGLNAALVDSPAEGSPAHELRLTPSGWQLITGGNTSKSVSNLQGLKVEGTVFANLPPSAELRSKLVFSKARRNDSVQAVTSPEQADYWLAGRFHAGKLEYSWVRPNALADHDMPLPASTDWFPASRHGDLEEYALRLAIIRTWMTLKSPPESRGFPYRLEVREKATGLPVKGSLLKEQGSEQAPYQFWLVADPAKMRAVNGRHVYIFGLDQTGKACILFPALDGMENYYPLRQEQPKLEYPLGDGFGVFEPYGPETYIIVTSREPLPRSLFEFDGVRLLRDVPGDPLHRLLAMASSGMRAPGPTPTDWSIGQIMMRSGK